MRDLIRNIINFIFIVSCFGGALELRSHLQGKDNQRTNNKKNLTFDLT